MSDFTRGLGMGLAGAGVNGIARAIQNISMAPYAAAIREQQARTQAAQQALAEAKLQAIRDKRVANDYWARQIEVPAEALGGYSPAEVGQLLKNTRTGKMMQAAGMLQPRNDGLDDIRTSVNNRIEQDAASLQRLAQNAALIQRAIEGKGIYRYINNGAAFNPSDGTTKIADSEVRALYRQKAKTTAGGATTARGWQIRQTTDGKTVRVNSRTGEVIPLGTDLTFGKGLHDWDNAGESAEMKEYQTLRARALAQGDALLVKELDDAARKAGLI